LKLIHNVFKVAATNLENQNLLRLKVKIFKHPQGKLETGQVAQV